MFYDHYSIYLIMQLRLNLNEYGFGGEAGQVGERHFDSQSVKQVETFQYLGTVVQSNTVGTLMRMLPMELGQAG